MCFDLNSSPPIPRISGAAIATQDLVLTSRDGTKFAAYMATAPNDAGKPAIVILPDIRGLYKFYETLADRFAERGYTAIAFDYFGRTAGVSKRDDKFPFMEHIPLTKTELIAMDTGAAVARLRQGKGNDHRPIFTIGFCFGGTYSWLQAVAGHGLAGSIGFYGHPTREPRGGGSPIIDLVGKLQNPILGHMGGGDQGIPVEEVEKFKKALKAAGRKDEILVYPGASHSFFDRKFDEFAKESEDAWKKTLAFIEANSKQMAGAHR